MLIAIVSDSHDHIVNLQRDVSRANREGAELLIHCGDLISPFMLKYLHAFRGPVHLIYGNNAGDQHLISSRCATAFDNIQHHGFHGTIVTGSLRIAFNHYPELARELALSGAYDLVCYGHVIFFQLTGLTAACCSTLVISWAKTPHRSLPKRSPAIFLYAGWKSVASCYWTNDSSHRDEINYSTSKRDH